MPTYLQLTYKLQPTYYLIRGPPSFRRDPVEGGLGTGGQSSQSGSCHRLVSSTEYIQRTKVRFHVLWQQRYLFPPICSTNIRTTTLSLRIQYRCRCTLGHRQFAAVNTNTQGQMSNGPNQACFTSTKQPHWPRIWFSLELPALHHITFTVCFFMLFISRSCPNAPDSWCRITLPACCRGCHSNSSSHLDGYSKMIIPTLPRYLLEVGSMRGGA